MHMEPPDCCLDVHEAHSAACVMNSVAALKYCNLIKAFLTMITTCLDASNSMTATSTTRTHAFEQNVPELQVV